MALEVLLVGEKVEEVLAGASFLEFFEVWLADAEVLLVACVVFVTVTGAVFGVETGGESLLSAL